MPFGFFKNPEVFNGYGLKRWDFNRPHISVGFTNKVFLHNSFSHDGMCGFARSMKNFPFRFSICFGYINPAEKSGLYFQGSLKEPYTSFKYLIFKHLFIGGNCPKWMIKRQQKLDEIKFEKMNAAYDAYMNTLPDMPDKQQSEEHNDETR